MTDAPESDLAPLGRRTCAWLLDAAIGGTLAAGFVDVTGGGRDLRTLWHVLTFKSVNGPAGHQLSTALSPTNTQLSALEPVLGLLAIMAVIALVGVAYRVVTTAMWGAGIGKALLGLRVVMDRPDRLDRGTVDLPSWGRAWARWAVPQGPGLIPLPATGLLAYLPALRDSRRRGLHDRAAGTIVIDLRARPRPTPASPAAVAASDLGYFTPSPAPAATGAQETPVAPSPR